VINTHRTSLLSVADLMLVLQDGTQQLFGPVAEVMQKIKEAQQAALQAAPLAGQARLAQA